MFARSDKYLFAPVSICWPGKSEFWTSGQSKWFWHVGDVTYKDRNVLSLGQHVASGVVFNLQRGHTGTSESSGFDLWDDLVIKSCTVPRSWLHWTLEELQLTALDAHAKTDFISPFWKFRHLRNTTQNRQKEGWRQTSPCVTAAPTSWVQQKVLAVRC